MRRAPTCPVAAFRLSLFQVFAGMILVLMVGTLNRVMIVELRRGGLAGRR